MNKSFKIARKPGQAAQAVGEQAGAGAATRPAPTKRARAKHGNGGAPAASPATQQLGTGPTTRKTIEVPEDYFYMVKMRALQQHMKEKDLWAEILKEYFQNNPNP
jgi:hypothetical protein